MKRQQNASNNRSVVGTPNDNVGGQNNGRGGNIEGISRENVGQQGHTGTSSGDGINAKESVRVGLQSSKTSTHSPTKASPEKCLQKRRRELAEASKTNKID